MNPCIDRKSTKDENVLSNECSPRQWKIRTRAVVEYSKESSGDLVPRASRNSA